MRALVVGPTTTLNTSVACHVLRTLHITSPHVVWNVVTSYQLSLDAYQACANVRNVTAFRDLKDEETDDSQGLVIEVLASSFFDKAWVRERLRTAPHLLVVTTSPVTFMDKTVLASFEQVYLSKTAAVDKQSQYFTLFADATAMSFVEFKKAIKGVATNQYGRVVMEQGKPGRLEVCDYSPLWDMPGAAATTTTVTTRTPGPTALKERPPAAVPPPPSPVPPRSSGAVERPPDTVVEAGRVELWLSMTLHPDCTAETVVDNLRTMLGNTLIESMLQTILYDTSAIKDHRLHVYVQVFEHRQDLFVSLAFNVLQSLRLASFITQGSLVL